MPRELLEKGIEKALKKPRSASDKGLGNASSQASAMIGFLAQAGVERSPEGEGHPGEAELDVRLVRQQVVDEVLREVVRDRVRLRVLSPPARVLLQTAHPGSDGSDADSRIGIRDSTYGPFCCGPNTVRT